MNLGFLSARAITDFFAIIKKKNATNCVWLYYQKRNNSQPLPYKKRLLIPRNDPIYQNHPLELDRLGAFPSKLTPQDAADTLSRIKIAMRININKQDSFLI